jgi:hypothetical protein
MLVVHTAGQPPNHGRTYLLNNGCPWNNKNAPKNIVSARIPRANDTFPATGARVANRSCGESCAICTNEPRVLHHFSAPF